MARYTVSDGCHPVEILRLIFRSAFSLTNVRNIALSCRLFARLIREDVNYYKAKPTLGYKCKSTEMSEYEFHRDTEVIPTTNSRRLKAGSKFDWNRRRRDLALIALRYAKRGDIIMIRKNGSRNHRYEKSYIYDGEIFSKMTDPTMTDFVLPSVFTCCNPVDYFPIHFWMMNGYRCRGKGRIISKHKTRKVNIPSCNLNAYREQLLKNITADLGKIRTELCIYNHNECYMETKFEDEFGNWFENLRFVISKKWHSDDDYEYGKCTKYKDYYNDPSYDENEKRGHNCDCRKYPLPNIDEIIPEDLSSIPIQVCRGYVNILIPCIYF